MKRNITTAGNITRQGFTLVETVLYMGLLSIFLLILTNLFVTVLEVRLESESRTAVDQDSQYVLSRLAYDIRRASAVTQPATGQTANSLSLLIDGQQFTYTQTGTVLELTTPTGESSVTSNGVELTQLSFQTVGNADVPGSKSTVRVDFTLQSQASTAQGPETRSFQTTIGLR